MILYDLIGAGPHPCVRCDRMLTWPEIAVDHINRDRLDNRPENLQVCCSSCNQTLRWVRVGGPGVTTPPGWMTRSARPTFKGGRRRHDRPPRAPPRPAGRRLA